MTTDTDEMSAPWVKSKEVSAFDEFDIDELLAQLTPEEIEELENEADPDVSVFSPLIEWVFSADKAGDLVVVHR